MKTDDSHKPIWVGCVICGFQFQTFATCSDRTCYRCRRKRFARLFPILCESIERWDTWRTFSLTLRNIPDDEFTRDRVRFLTQCFKKLSRQAFFTHAVQGGFWIIHVTNHGRGWHVHIHGIYHGKYLPVQVLSKAWLKLTKNSYKVSVNKADTPEDAARYLLSDFQGWKRDENGVRESTIRSQDREIYNRVFRGMRLVQSFGDCYNISLKKECRCPNCKQDGLSALYSQDWYCRRSIKGYGGRPGIEAEASVGCRDPAPLEACQ